MRQATLFEDRDQTPQAPLSLPKVEYDFPSRGWNGIALVGEAPGAEEVRQGHPFVGRSGQLLDKLLEKASIERKRCLVANAFRFQPPGNKVDHFFLSRRAAKEQGVTLAENLGPFGSVYCRGEFAGEIEHLRSVLEQFHDYGKLVDKQSNKIPLPSREGLGEGALNNPDLGIVDGPPLTPLPSAYAKATARPKDRPRRSPQDEGGQGERGARKMIIIALGRTPLWALTGENGLLEKIGKRLPCRLLPGVQVIPTFHPSFILRGNWARQDEWLEHLLTAKQTLQTAA